MTSRAKVNRKRIMRSAILSASMLSLIPLVGAMQSAASEGEDAAGIPQTQLMAAAQPLATTTAPITTSSQPAAVATAAVTTPAQTATSTQAAAKTQNATATQTTTATSYTRTKAS